MSTEKALPNEERTPTEPNTLSEALQVIREDAKAKGTDKLTMEEIIEEIEAYRREKRKQG